MTTATARFHQVIASQAVLGEDVGIQHYARMVGLAADPAERLALLEDAWRERAHLLTMQGVASRAGVSAVTPSSDPYWTRVRAAFEQRADAGDLLGLYVIQDIVLEAYAVVIYEALLPALGDEDALQVRRIAEDERAHLARGVAELTRAAEHDREGVIERVDFANERVARVLSEWVKVDDCAPVCGVCGMVGGGCAKDELRTAGVDVESFQPAFADTYGKALRDAGLPVDRVARWLARLIS